MGPRNESVVEAMDGHTSFQMPVEAFLFAIGIASFQSVRVKIHTNPLPTKCCSCLEKK